MNEKLIDLVKTVINSDLPIGTRSAIVNHYMLPKPGKIISIMEDPTFEAGAVDRPTREDIDIENNPRLKEEFADTERLLGGIEDED